MSMAMIALDMLKPQGRLVVCGDPMQLPPIRRASYPDPAGRGGVPLHSSVLSCLLPSIAAAPAVLSTSPERFVDMLEETMRMSQALSDFTTRLYRDRLRVAAPSGAYERRPLQIRAPPGTPNAAARMVVQMSGQALVTVELSAQGGPRAVERAALEMLVRAEATLVADLVVAIVRGAEWPRSSGVDHLYVVTPHRVQRAQVRQLVAARLGRDEAASVTVDTVERMQGKEAEAVIVCYGFLDADRVASESAFLFNCNRLNVSLSRARRLCVLISGEAVRNVHLGSLWSLPLQTSFAHLAAFRERSSAVLRHEAAL
eukprot:Unigene15307_Nuclearia_a/m.45763 Unigene15307_Nuclearia_a/g.45763  ORF Unigene15307_Nuclearia_a/g.45763 Unigene15307_Nuclearia_a/m.45763 type:complete len:314 (-) Unigene15307_Nuclearia_a:281-1222(-)